MEEFIVKVNSYYNQECIRNGTGIVIDNNLILTAKHVVCGQEHFVVINDCKISAQIIKENSAVAVLKIETNSLTKVADIFCLEEIFSQEVDWKIYGFISNEQLEHSVTGRGILPSVTEADDWDCYLTNIIAGKANDYSGLSGAPVLCNNRIVGILQMQSYDNDGSLGIRMSSVNRFADLLQDKNIKENECKLVLKKKLSDFTVVQINKNIKSRKYIPDIYVEESDYKEFLRYFADPILFLRKAIREIKDVNFCKYNKLLDECNEKKITFDRFNENISFSDFNNVFEDFNNEICYAENKTKALKEIKNSQILSQYFKIRQNIFNNSIEHSLWRIKNKIKYNSLKFLLLTKDAGQGKTNFLCDFTMNFLIKKNYFVLYYNAYDFKENPWLVISEELKSFGNHTIEYIFSVIEDQWQKTGRSFVIIIDGLNENTVMENFGANLKGFLEKCNNYSFIKVILTTRNEFLKEKFSGLENGTYEKFFEHIDMAIRNESFKERIFKGYLQYFQIIIRENTLSDRAYKKLTEDILLLRFFCEVNAGKKQLYLYDVYKYEVFNQYIEKKADEYSLEFPVMQLNHKDNVYSLLDKIAKYMLDNMEFFKVPSNIFSEKEQSLLYKMVSNEVVFKDEELIQIGMLRKTAMVISFTFDEFRDYCLTEYILKNYDKEKISELWGKLEENYSTIKEGVSKYLFYLARVMSPDSLLPILKELPGYEKLYWRYIWGLEDKWFQGDDKRLWKRELIDCKKYSKRIVYDLILKYDCDYFKIININLLFEVLNELAIENSKYSEFLNEMFQIYYKHEYGYSQTESSAACPYNYLLDWLQANVEYDKWNIDHRIIYKLTLYLFDLDCWNTINLWKNLYEFSPDIAIDILKEMNNYPNGGLNGNIKQILSSLVNMDIKQSSYDIIIKQLYEENIFCNDIDIDFDSIFTLIYGEKK
ncbi:serine protease family protein [Pectinatus haikarae]|uniref:serine protease n=1 Tax=Pectinatus haikarae TaxID=349096 RepID=UPI0018C81461|nr:serine protease [Pectinatus haikarae]